VQILFGYTLHWRSCLRRAVRLPAQTAVVRIIYRMWADVYSPFSHDHKFNTRAKYGDPPYITYTIIIINKKGLPPRVNVQIKLLQRENGRVPMKGNRVALTWRPPHIHSCSYTRTYTHRRTSNYVLYVCVCVRWYTYNGPRQMTATLCVLHYFFSTARVPITILCAQNTYHSINRILEIWKYRDEREAVIVIVLICRENITRGNDKSRRKNSTFIMR